MGRDPTLEAKAHELIGQLNPGELAAVVHLLEIMVDDEDGEEVVSPSDIAKFQASREHCRQGRMRLHHGAGHRRVERHFALVISPVDKDPCEEDPTSPGVPAQVQTIPQPSPSRSQAIDRYAKTGGAAAAASSIIGCHVLDGRDAYR